MSYDYRVVAVSKYRDGRGEFQTTYSNIGVAFVNKVKDTGRKSISLKIGPEILVSNRCALVLFEPDDDGGSRAGGGEVDDEIPL